MKPYTPTFDSPYPVHQVRRVSQLHFDSDLDLKRSIEGVLARSGGDADYILAKPYTVRFFVVTTREAYWQTLTVPAGMLTDLASVPWWARRLINRVGPHLEASIVHDWLYIAWQSLSDGQPQRQDRDFADLVLLAGMEAAEVPAWKRTVIYRAVRIGGWGTYQEREPGFCYAEV